MRAKPRIIKRSDQWQIELPGYGFHRGAIVGPFTSHKAAVRHLGTSWPGAASQSLSAASVKEPARFDRFTTLRPVIK